MRSALETVSTPKPSRRLRGEQNQLRIMQMNNRRCLASTNLGTRTPLTLIRFFRLAQWTEYTSFHSSLHNRSMVQDDNLQDTSVIRETTTWLVFCAMLPIVMLNYTITLSSHQHSFILRPNCTGFRSPSREHISKHCPCVNLMLSSPITVQHRHS